MSLLVDGFLLLRYWRPFSFLREVVLGTSESNKMGSEHCAVDPLADFEGVIAGAETSSFARLALRLGFRSPKSLQMGAIEAYD